MPYPAVIPPDQNLLPIVPTDANSPGPVTPVVIDDSVAAKPATTFNDLPPQAQNIVANIASPDPQKKLDAVNTMQQIDSQAKDYHPNVQPQWGKMLFSAIKGNWDNVYKYYNGGAEREEKARDAFGNEYWKGFNEIGDNGIIKDRNGRELTPTEKKELADRGGIQSASDQLALKSTPWINGQSNATLAQQGLTSRFQLATNDAYNAANLAGASNKNLDESINILQENPGVKAITDHISMLPSDKRQKILGLVNEYKTITANTAKANEKRASGQGNVQNTSTNATNVGGGVSGNVGGGEPLSNGAVAPPSAGITGKAGISTSNTGMVSGGVTAGEANTANTSSGNTLQQQQNVRTLIERELQGVISNPKDFDNYMRIQALDAQNKLATSQLPAHIIPPGYSTVTQSDAQLGGSKAMIANGVEGLRNNALTAAWANELFKAARDQAATGKSYDLNELANKFQQSDVYKGINNTFAHKLNIELGGTGTLSKGDIVVDPKTNRVGRFPGVK
jgi:hypothetical protein